MKLKLSTILIFILILFLTCIAPVSALRVNFQESTWVDDITYICTGNTLSCWYGYTRSAVGGNSFVTAYHVRDGGVSGGGSTTYIAQNPNPMTYAAATRLGGGGSPGYQGVPTIILFDSAKNILYQYISGGLGSGDVYRYEVKMSGGTAYIFRNGVQVATSGALAVNPSYVGFGTWNYGTGGWSQWEMWDDFVYGATEDKYIFDMPEQGFYIVKKDMLNPASSGFCWANGTVINVVNMPTSYGRGAIGIPPDPLPNETITLQNYATGVPYATKYTGTTYFDILMNWDISTALINSGAPYGFYQMRIANAKYPSAIIAYMSMGATISWDSATYSTNDVATVTYTISPTYYDVATYSYSMKVVDIYGTEYEDQPVTSATGSFTVDLDEATYDPGYYFTEIVATPLAGGSDILMGYDVAEVVNYVTIRGYVLNATTALPLSGAAISIKQASTTYSGTSGYNGNYSTFGTLFYPDYSLWINTSKTNFAVDNHTWTPLIAKTYDINISMVISNPNATSNVTLGGVVYEKPYYKPLEGATVTVQNTSIGTCITTSNMAGYYSCGNLQVNSWYNDWASKLGFTNSTVWTKWVWGI